MSNVEHIFENTICKLEKGVYNNMTYNDIMNDIRADSNYDFINDVWSDVVRLDSDDIYTMAVYACTTYRYSIRNQLLKELEEAGVDLTPWMSKLLANSASPIMEWK